MCKYCEKEEIIFKDEIISPLSWLVKDMYLNVNEITTNEYGLFIDKRQNNTYLRFANLNDCNCIESGNYIQIDFCPFCGKNLNKGN